MTEKIVISNDLVLTYDNGSNMRFSRINQEVEPALLLSYALAINSLQQTPAQTAIREQRSRLTRG